MPNEYIEVFSHAANDWICEGYSATLTYIGIRTIEGIRLAGGSVEVNPLPGKDELSFDIATSDIVAGMLVFNKRPKGEILAILEAAVQGIIYVDGNNYSLGEKEGLDFYSEMAVRERWSTLLHLQVSFPRPVWPQALDLIKIDDQLRTCSTPFDGLADLESWLSINPIGKTPPSLHIRVGPPIDIRFELCSLTDNILNLVLHGHPQLDLHKVSLCVKGFPGVGLSDRKQVTSEINWKDSNQVLQEGTAKINFQHSDSVLIMLSVENISVTRQWVLDSGKARNSRFVAMQMFNTNLRMLKQAILEPQDANRFELGVSALLFLMGFSAAVQIETNSPDIIVTTPGGKVILIECTTRIADFSTKLGKLVDRRGALRRLYQASEHPLQVYGILVCGLPRDQIALRAAEFEGHNLTLFSKEDLASAFERARFPHDSDELVASLAKKPIQNDLFGLQ